MKWIDNVKECLKKRELDVRQARRMAQDRSEGEFIGHSPGYEPLTLLRCQSCMKTLKGGSLFVAKPTT